MHPKRILVAVRQIYPPVFFPSLPPHLPISLLHPFVHSSQEGSRGVFGLHFEEELGSSDGLVEIRGTGSANDKGVNSGGGGRGGIDGGRGGGVGGAGGEVPEPEHVIDKRGEGGAETNKGFGGAIKHPSFIRRGDNKHAHILPMRCFDCLPIPRPLRQALRRPRAGVRPNGVVVQIDVVKNTCLDRLNNHSGGCMRRETNKFDSSLLLVFSHDFQTSSRAGDPLEVLRSVYAMEAKQIEVGA